jgi:N-acetylmuramoyl-L-alanine amidase
VIATRLTLAVFYFLVIVSCSSSSADRGSLEIGAAQQAGVETFRQVQESPIKVVYPTASTKVPAASTFIVGSISAGGQLSCNGMPVRLSPQGFFAHVVPLKPGENEFELVESGISQASRKVVIHRDVDPPAVSDNDVKIVGDSLQPSENKGVRPGEMIEFAVQATPNSEVTVNLGKKFIYLRTLEAQSAASSGKRKKSHAVRSSTKVNVNTGMDTAYGQVYQRHSHGRPDHYFGHYKVTADDTWIDLKPKIMLKHAGKTISQVFPQTLTVVQQPNLAQTAHDATIVRVGPNASRITPLQAGIRLLVDGWQGDQMCCFYAPGKHVWIARQDLIFENGDDKNGNGQGPTQSSVARTINLKEEPAGEYLSLPLSQKLPYQVEQTLEPNCLKLHVYGVTADTDWVSDTPEKGQLIEGVTWKQIGDSHYEITISIKGHRQWGYRVEYDGTELKLHIKKAPALLAAERLDGLSICIDPGHGGSERGAMGPSGVAEAAVNLGIALKLRDLLTAQGAKVIMTRSTDKDVSLDDRVKIADESGVDILLSVHNNSLPDGRDPWTERGSSSYYYHPQSKELARALKNGLLDAFHLPDLGSRYQNLALCRPSGMPAVLAEVGFMINPEEYTILISPEGQEKAAQGLFRGLESYLGRQTTSPSPTRSYTYTRSPE